MPEIRPFRALRYDRTTVADPALVVAPPYEVVDDMERERLLARHPANVVRLDRPTAEIGDEPDDRYRRAARTIAAWRSDGTLHKDPHPSIYVYEQAWFEPGSGLARTRRGFFARVRLEAFGPGSEGPPNGRTRAGPSEDRYRLLRATGVNTSPAVGLYEDRDGVGRAVLDALTDRPADLDIADEDGILHRLWAVPADGDAAADVAPLLAVAARDPLAIADGLDRYEAALRYRDERRMSRSCEEDPAFDYILMLLLDASTEPLTVPPVHRIVRGLGDDGVARLLEGLDAWFDVRRDMSEPDLLSRFGPAARAAGGAGRFGSWTGSGGALLTARRDAFEAYLPRGGAALRALDVTLLEIALERLAGIGPDAVAAGAVAYLTSAARAIESVATGSDGADAAFLLEPMPVASILAVAADRDRMPQNSTALYPKALTGLVINPHEW